VIDILTSDAYYPLRAELMQTSSAWSAAWNALDLIVARRHSPIISGLVGTKSKRFRPANSCSIAGSMLQVCRVSCRAFRSAVLRIQVNSNIARGHQMACWTRWPTSRRAFPCVGGRDHIAFKSLFSSVVLKINLWLGCADDGSDLLRLQRAIAGLCLYGSLRQQ